MRSMLAVTLCCLTTACQTGLAAAQGGAKIVRIPDGQESRCIDSSKDRIWLVLRGLVTERTAGWLTKDTAVSVLLKPSLRSEAEQNKSVTFPLMSQTTIADYPTGQVSVPVEKLVVGGLRLTQDAVRYAGLELELTVLNQRGKTPLGEGLEVLAEVTKKLPIPASPIKEAGTYLLEYANKVVDAEVKAQDPGDVARSATMVFEFAPNAPNKDCPGSTFESTGTIAVLYAKGLAGQHLVPLDSIGQYCWSAELKPSFILRAAPKANDDDCVAVRHRSWFQVTNNYVALVLNAVRAEGVLGPPGIDETAALERCRANGVAEADCLFGR
jgi:hypothetical protein